MKMLNLSLRYGHESGCESLPAVALTADAVTMTFAWTIPTRHPKHSVSQVAVYIWPCEHVVVVVAVVVVVRKMIRRSGTFAAFCTQLGADWSFLGHKIECDRTKHGHRHRLNREGRCKSSGLDQSGAVRRRVACAAPKSVENKAYAEGGRWRQKATS